MAIILIFCRLSYLSLRFVHFVAEPRFRLLGISFSFFLLPFLCVCRLFFSFVFGVMDKIESSIGLRCRPSNSDPRVYG